MDELGSAIVTNPPADPSPTPRPTPPRKSPPKDDDRPVLPRGTQDDTDEGWGENSRHNDDRLLEDRPPHWGSD